MSIVRQCLDAAQDGTVSAITVALVDGLRIAKGWMSSAPGRAQAAAHDAGLVKIFLSVAVREGAHGRDREPDSAGRWAAECITALLVSLCGDVGDTAIEGDGLVAQLFAALTQSGVTRDFEMIAILFL